MHCLYETLTRYWAAAVKKKRERERQRQREKNHIKNYSDNNNQRRVSQRVYDKNEWIQTTNTIRFNHIRTEAIIILNNRNIISNVRYTQIMSMRSSVVVVAVVRSSLPPSPHYILYQLTMLRSLRSLTLYTHLPLMGIRNYELKTD